MPLISPLLLPTAQKYENSRLMKRPHANLRRLSSSTPTQVPLAKLTGPMYLIVPSVGKGRRSNSTLAPITGVTIVTNSSSSLWSLLLPRPHFDRRGDRPLRLFRFLPWSLPEVVFVGAKNGFCTGDLARRGAVGSENLSLDGRGCSSTSDDRSSGSNASAKFVKGCGL